MDSIDRVIHAGKAAKAHAQCEKARYHRLRNAAIEFLGGKCKHSGCEERDPSRLQIHHIHPHQNGGWKRSPGNDKIKFWKAILAGNELGELYCKEHHVSDGHDGNTSNLKKR